MDNSDLPCSLLCPLVIKIFGPGCFVPARLLYPGAPAPLSYASAKGWNWVLNFVARVAQFDSDVWDPTTRSDPTGERPATRKPGENLRA